ncbi:nuclear transport factor 2 family protein [Pseudoroseomonas cervicalis]|uniref:nuclear transport factor 2 family protein n=1 Tax=Teichococcus cervicalis TaxID=204525 RepID=UPI00278A7F7D|nr:nuclear transport factor 2 family protein [Pseudoroseomonas cervicalis]MDQ1080814.1 ketosteroid isomerase-like protein [Pseudoroseomonas cervicalis]
MPFAQTHRRLAAAGRPLLLALALSAIAVAAAPSHAQTAARPAAGAAAQGSDATARNAALVREAFEGWAQRGENVFRLLAPDVRWTIHGSGPVAGTYIGVEDFVERASQPLVSRLTGPIRPVVHHLWAVEDRVIIRFDGASTTTSGAPYRNQFLWIFRMQDGAVVEAEAFLDLIAYQQVVENNAPRQR